MPKSSNNQITYVYRFTNLVNGKAYVGISTQPKKRKRDHESGRGSLLLWRAIQKYGLENFDYSLVSKHATYSAALSREIKEISKHNSVKPNGYNLTLGGEGCVGYVASPQTLEKKRRAWLGRKHTPETKAKMSAAQTGRTFSEASRKKLSEACIGKQRRLGVILSQETKDKIGNANRGRVMSKASSLKKRKAMLGRKFTDDHKAKIGASHLNRMPETYARGASSGMARPVLVDGWIYGCVSDAAADHGVLKDTIRERILRNQKTDPDNWGYLKKTTP